MAIVIPRSLRLLMPSMILAAVLLGDAAPAAACSCASSSAREAFDKADVVFVGTLVEREVARHGEISSSDDPAVHTFDVSAVYKGDVVARQQIVSRAGGEACGLELPDGQAALVFGSTTSWAGVEILPGKYWGDLCNGTRTLAAGSVPPSFGEPREPGPNDRHLPAVEADGRTSSHRAEPRAWRLTAVLGATAFGALAVAAVIVIVGRKRART